MLNKGKGYILCHVRKVTSSQKYSIQPKVKRFKESHDDEEQEEQEVQEDLEKQEEEEENINLSYKKKKGNDSGNTFKDTKPLDALIEKAAEEFDNMRKPIEPQAVLKSGSVLQKIDEYIRINQAKSIKYVELYNLVSGNYLI